MGNKGVKTYMLEIDRLDGNEIIGAKLVPHEYGGWVDLNDYENLRQQAEKLGKLILELEADNKRLKAVEWAEPIFPHEIISKLNDKIKDLEAQVERLKFEKAKVEVSADSSSYLASFPEIDRLEARNRVLERVVEVARNFDLPDDADTMWFDTEEGKSYFRPKVPMDLIKNLRDALKASPAAPKKDMREECSRCGCLRSTHPIDVCEEFQP